MAASSNRHMMDQEGEMHFYPRCELFPQKTDFMLFSGFLAACAEVCWREGQGAWSGAGSRPVPSQTCQVGCDCSSQTAPHPQHGNGPSSHHTHAANVHHPRQRRVFRSPRTAGNGVFKCLRAEMAGRMNAGGPHFSGEVSDWL